MEQPAVATAFAKIFKMKTGAEWGSLKPGDRAQPGMYWLQQQSTPDLKATWQYYVSDGVDGKKTGWYPYVASATSEVEDLYAQHSANANEGRTATRLVSSGRFTYKIDLGKMTQENTRTRKVRPIRRAVGDESRCNIRCVPHAMIKKTMKVSGAMKGMRAMKSTKVHKPMQVMKAAKLKKKVLKIGSKKQVLSGKRQRTVGGLRAENLMKNSKGKIVSKRKSVLGKICFAKIEGWVEACKKARAELGLIGFVPVTKGSQFYEKAKEFYARA